MRKDVPAGQILLALAAATLLVAWLGIDLADGSITRRHQLYSFPSFRFILELVLEAAAAVITAVAWIRTLGGRSSR